MIQIIQESGTLIEVLLLNVNLEYYLKYFFLTTRESYLQLSHCQIRGKNDYGKDRYEHKKIKNQ